MSLSKEQNANWIRLAHRPWAVIDASAVLNDEEFVVIRSNYQIFKYNIVRDEWKHMWEVDELNGHEYTCSAVINRETNRLYVSGSRYFQMAVVDLLTGKMVHELCDDPWDHGNLVNVNGTIHRVGGFDNKHVNWNYNVGDYENVIHTFPWDPRSVSLVYVKSKDIILMLGGESGGYDGNDNEIEQKPLGMWRFQIALSKWEQIDMGIEHSLLAGRTVLTPDEQKIIIIGANIYVLDIQDENHYKLMQSSVTFQLPTFRGAYSVLMNHAKAEIHLVTFGWMRRQKHIPKDIKKLIDQFAAYSEYMIHCVAGGWSQCGSKDNPKGDSDHQMIALADILAIEGSIAVPSIAPQQAERQDQTLHLEHPTLPAAAVGVWENCAAR